MSRAAPSSLLSPRLSGALLGLSLVLFAGCRDSGELESPAEEAVLPADSGLRSVADFTEISDERERSLALFAELGQVISHPRCVNCHPAGERPLQGEAGFLHQPLVVRGEDGHGAAAMQCATCHGEANYLNVPGNPKWHLAPAEMAWEGKSLPEICAQIKDPARNGDMSLDQLAEHMAYDELVGYGWKPPAQLEPAPGNQALFGQLVRAWIASGAHCPEP
ncbi:Isoquinoline 1-oxidoreductase subunit [Pseudenhygromyxa sp. WMMC2535]|uniref:Isoquinoline 1-oxidoreductase subunit n=1 Tax=Pseudenhygromyxa sp. WMMC2535 TaxID=2712867 RepID=UPI001552817F|nr:Isoquinoline 1-oxidoreductase subunit [Pseudenhygromyxa sp. WMMC2535]NVB36356.1 Isoquinoline 1-oxidoreductase subunit [Pseudenhygromyxa sp. WMMC2535]